MKIDPEDPRLTAHALGELDPIEADDFEKILQECPEAQSEVDAIRDTITTIKEEFDGGGGGATCSQPLVVQDSKFCV